MKKYQLLNTKLFLSVFLCVVFSMVICPAMPCFASEASLRIPDLNAGHFDVVSDIAPATPVVPETPAVEKPTNGWLGAYHKVLGMCLASVITTIFGAAFAAFFIAICWGKLVELYGALGGLIGGGAIVGTFWVFNHKLPGIGIAPSGIPHDDGFGIYQYGMIVQAFHCTGPWIDMGLAIFVGLFTMSLLERLRARKLDSSLPNGPALISEAFPRVLSVILGGIAGGAIVGLIGFTGAQL